MKHAYLMGPLAEVKPWKDTTYHLMRAAAARGHRVCHITPDGLHLEDGRVRAEVTWLQVNEDTEHPFTEGEREEQDLGDMDVVWIRTDPPLDRRYFYTTLLLDHLPPSVRVVNRPSGIRNWNEKLAALHYPQFSPPTLITADPARIVQFSLEYGRVAIKPLDGHGGKGIHFYQAAEGDPENDSDPPDMLDCSDPTCFYRAPAPLDTATHDGRRWVIAQKYLPAARDGDKRILLLDGEPLGAILRLHAEDGELNNLDAGGTAHPAVLTARDEEICAAMKPGLQAQGVFFAGIDIIGGMLIEVNVTSPTGLQELCRFSGHDHHHDIIRALEPDAPAQNS